jgi:hypothetical protein
MERDGVTRGDAFGFALEHLDGGPQVRVTDGKTDAAISLQRIERGAALHLIRYDHDDIEDRVRPLDRLVLEVRVPFDVGDVEAFSPQKDLAAASEVLEDGRVRLTLRDVPLYGIVRLAQR